MEMCLPNGQPDFIIFSTAPIKESEGSERDFFRPKLIMSMLSVSEAELSLDGVAPISCSKAGAWRFRPVGTRLPSTGEYSAKSANY